MPISEVHIDPFIPKLKNSPALRVTEEQKFYLREVLDICCSDSKFAEKAYKAILFSLTSNSAKDPVVTSLNPTQATLGDPSFTLHVIGTGFDTASQIIWNGSAEPTTFVSETELTTGVDMSTAVNAVDIPVVVENRFGVWSNPLTFTFLAPLAPSTVVSSKTDSMIAKDKK